jgi:uncharacterized pyridoxamine 5'-phosphate oxidase family protein
MKNLHHFLDQHKLAVLSTVNEKNLPEAALVGFAVTKDLQLIFDTVATSRKYKNLLKNPTIAFVIGWENETTIQYEGVAKVLSKDDALLETYFEKFPEGRERKSTWKDIVYFVVEPKWIRYSDFNEPQKIEEFNF